MPPAIAFPYLRGALRWVIEYAPAILEARAKEWSAKELEEALASVGAEIELTEAKHAQNTKKVTRDGLTRLTAAACFAVIAALSARRRSEIADLGAGCVHEDSEGRHRLWIYIAKTEQDYNQIPIPAVVHKAVRCMEAISEDARKRTGTDGIWQFHADQGNKVRSLRPEQDLNNLTRHIDAEGSQDWKFSAHQFRRFFAMLYFWRYEKGDVAGLAHHLRHFDLEMTRRYVTDNQFGKIWTDVEEEWRRRLPQSRSGRNEGDRGRCRRAYQGEDREDAPALPQGRRRGGAQAHRRQAPAARKEVGRRGQAPRVGNDLRVPTTREREVRETRKVQGRQRDGSGVQPGNGRNMRTLPVRGAHGALQGGRRGRRCPREHTWLTDSPTER